MTTWLNVAAVAAGGAFGSVTRYLIAVASAAIPGGSTMLGTTAANVLGCAAIGALAGYAEIEEVIGERAVLAIRVGFLGGLTTFSSFAAESTNLATDGRLGGASLYVAANLFLGWAVLVASAGIMKGWMTP